MCEGIPCQVNFLIDEAASVGKGAHTTISYIHYDLEHYRLGEQHAHLHADNCAGQNKNDLGRFRKLFEQFFSHLFKEQTKLFK